MLYQYFLLQILPASYIWTFFLYPVTILSSKSVYHRILTSSLLLGKKQKARETSQNSRMRRLVDPWQFHMDKYWWNLTWWNQGIIYTQNLKKNPHSRMSSVFLIFFLSVFHVFSFALAKWVTSSQMIRCLSIAWAANRNSPRSVGMILVHLIFKTHRVGTDVFSGDCEMKFMNKGAWVMLEDNMVSGLCETNACW